jgi:3-hexulose-6-phosphate synthase
LLSAPKRVQIQLALDVTRLDVAIAIAEETVEYVDRLEVGTPLALAEGAPRAIAALRARFPSMPLIADCKIMDRGGQITHACVDAGATGVIVEAAAPRETLEAVYNVAAEYGAEASADSLGIHDIYTLAERIEDIPFDFVILHRGKDEQASGGDLPLRATREAAYVPGLPRVALAGGISPRSAAVCVQASNVEVLIVGESILESLSPRSTAAEIRRICDETRIRA